MSFWKKTGIVLFVVLLFEAVAASAVAWSFMESARSSLNMGRIATDSHASNLLVSIAGSVNDELSRGKISKASYTLDHFVRRTRDSEDRFKISELFILSRSGKVIAHTDKTKTALSYDKRKPDPAYADLMVAQKLRKWQVTDPVVTQMPVTGILEKTLKFVPGFNDVHAVISTPVYHPYRLDVIGSLHMVYERENLMLFMEKQMELLEWMGYNYILVALGTGLLAGVIFVFFGAGRRIVYRSENVPVISRQEEAPVSVVEKVTPPATPAPKTGAEIPVKPPEAPVAQNRENAKAVLSAIYLGKK